MLRTTLDYQEKRYDDATYLNGRDFSLNMRTTIGLGPDKALFFINGGNKEIASKGWWRRFLCSPPPQALLQQALPPRV